MNVCNVSRSFQATLPIPHLYHSQHMSPLSGAYLACWV